ncbi:MAG: acetyl-CoA carboxylase carboxyltransferase subunit alpha [Lachnospiraceae bacterium]|nr:acetyl-CoA carboxylase carboxyltransferase subunit alpha [Lachnospiraceae bacterium]
MPSQIQGIGREVAKLYLEDTPMNQTPYNRVKLARDNKRPTGLDYIRNIFKGFIELHGDRRFGDDPAIVGGIARLEGSAVTVIAVEKGHTAKERARRNFGAPSPEGYRKALRLMKQAEKFGRPVICLIDTSGACCDVGAEERGQGQAIAENLTEMSTLCVPIISLLIGEGGSGGALALAVADRVWMLENAVYSVISPEGCASILWKDAAYAETAAASLKLTAEDALSFGVIEQIISENDIGKKEFYTRIRSLLAEEIRTLSTDPELVGKRYDRFRRLGTNAMAGQTL